MMKRGAFLAVIAFAALVVIGAPLMASVVADDATAVGKVTAYEAGKTLSVQVGDDAKTYKIDAETKIEGELAVGKEVSVWVKDGVVTKAVVK